MFRDRIIVDDSLVATDDGYSVRARMPWYRALPISCLVQVDLRLDGVGAEPATLTIETDSIELTLRESAEVTDRTWYVLDDLIIRVHDRTKISPGPHEVSLSLGIRIPYLPVDGKPLVIVEHFSKTMTAEEVAA